MSDDIVDQMISAWNEPVSTDHDPRELLVLGAREIHKLRRDLAGSSAVAQMLYAANNEMAQELRSLQPDPNAPLYMIGIVVVVMATIAACVILG